MVTGLAAVKGWNARSAEVLKFRDDAWACALYNPECLTLVERKFGPQERKKIEDMTRIKLRRHLLGD